VICSQQLTSISSIEKQRALLRREFLSGRGQPSGSDHLAPVPFALREHHDVLKIHELHCWTNINATD
jgi:hypothetical protein